MSCLIKPIDNLNTLFEVALNYIKENQSSDMKNLSCLLMAYTGEDWKKYVSQSNVNFSCEYKKYLVKNDEMLDMYIITWPEHTESCIHDHPNYGCIMRVLQGELCEEEYENSNKIIKYKKTNVLPCCNKNFGFKKGKDLLHKILNKSDSIAVSIHFYSRGGHKMVVYEEQS